jgi:UDP-glucose 4-epimerase
LTVRKIIRRSQFTAMRENVLITGGAGFLGSHLCGALAHSSDNVTVLDNLSSGPRSNLQQAKSLGKIRLIVGDCKNPRDVRRALSRTKTVYHFAANPEVRLDLTNPSTCFRENIYATHILLEAIRKSDVNTIVFASTSTVYGDAKIIPTPENYSPMEPVSIYGASKLASEALLTSYCHTYKKRAVILRLANIIGPRSSHGVLRDFITRLRKNPKKLDILGDGHQTKSYLYVKDCVDAILKSTQTTGERIEIFNVGSEDQIEVARIAQVLVEEMELEDVQFKFTGGPDGGRGWVGDVKNMLLEVSKMKSKGWTPKHNSEQSVRLAARQILSKAQ